MKRQTIDTTKLIGGIIGAVILSIAGSLTGGHYEGHKQIWSETGDHFQDLVMIEQTQAKEISDLKVAVSNLQQQIKQPKRK
jgi:hypothetical protein